MASSVNTPGSSFFIDVLMGWTSLHEGKSIKDFENCSNSQDKTEERHSTSGLIICQSKEINKTDTRYSEEAEITQDNNKMEWMSSCINNKDRKTKASEQLPADLSSKGKTIEDCQLKKKIAGFQNNQHKETTSLEKPNQSYIALISRAILSTPQKRLQLSDIYQWIMDTYPYYHNQDKSWRNSVRHNLSLNECFIKVGRSDNGKGHYWAVHPANLEAFSHGDYQRRRARRRMCRVSSVLGCTTHLPPCNLLYDAQRFCIWCPPLRTYSNPNRKWPLVEHFQQQPQRFQGAPFFWPWHQSPLYL